jgi:hypothetical protein
MAKVRFDLGWDLALLGVRPLVDTAIGMAGVRERLSILYPLHPSIQQELDYDCAVLVGLLSSVIGTRSSLSSCPQGTTERAE